MTLVSDEEADDDKDVDTLASQLESLVAEINTPLVSAWGVGLRNKCPYHYLVPIHVWSVKWPLHPFAPFLVLLCLILRLPKNLKLVPLSSQEMPWSSAAKFIAGIDANQGTKNLGCMVRAAFQSLCNAYESMV